MDETNHNITLSLTLEAIGVFSCSRKYPYEAPRQGNLAGQEEIGVLRLRAGQNFEQALRELERFERLWLIYGFHQNAGWKPVVRPPRAGAPKVGVFASRSPYRPNGLGLSCVELVKIRGRELTLRNFDLLDGTPVYDIKPYLPYADSFADAAAGWTADFDRDARVYAIEIQEIARTKFDWLAREADVDLERFVTIQLREDPDDDSRKRISRPGGAQSRERVLAYRTLRVDYRLPADETQPIKITNVRSGYTSGELDDSDSPDRYGDLAVHRRFRERFGEK